MGYDRAMRQIEITVQDGIATLAIVNPPHGFMTQATVDELAAALDRVEAEAEIGAVVLTGGLPGVFIRHYSLAELSERAEDMARRGVRVDLARPIPERPFHACMRRIEASPKPFIAAINGTCMGGGFETALSCDIRIAQAGTYSIGLPEINLGILPGGGGTQKLPRLIGQGPALYLLLQGKTLSPEEALGAGLVSEVVADVRARAQALAASLARKPRQALAYVKALGRGTFDRPLKEGLSQERTLFAELMTLPEARRLLGEGASEKRDIRDDPGYPGQGQR
ncbi:MAG: enoyl-CoA hydratase/isomerase family protein [Alphaproteobacteria bacterium]|nr:enoyl-CoA hydratase/isomerase family protein [Alphaproteobacteria bacterium]